MGSDAVVPDLAWKRDGATYALDVHAHTAIKTAGRSLSSHIASADNLKKNGKGTIEALNNARIAADAATAEATAAKAANASNHRELAANAAKKRAACDIVYTAGYDIAAAACGDNFFPAGFTEFAGWSDSAMYKQILRFITHKGDCLKADEEGERFDAGAEATWATRKHRSFMIHTVAAAAARATYRAAAAESKRSRLAAPLPASIKQCAFHHIHAPHRRARRDAEMRNLLPNTVR